jgi:hypothetical protein
MAVNHDNIRALRDQTQVLVDDTSAGYALELAVECFDEALLRLRGEPLAGHLDQPEKDPFVLRMESRISPEQ